jgi:hypothetical protein
MCMSKTKVLSISMIICIGASIQILAAGPQQSANRLDSSSNKSLSSLEKERQNINSLQESRQSGKPALAFFYYSVACSCTAARCAIAAAAIDSIPQLKGGDGSLGFFSVDAFIAPEAESLFNIMIMPAIVYYDSTGIEINRLEWGMNRESIITLIQHPEIIQKPID